MMSKFIYLKGICGKPLFLRKSAIIGFHEHSRDGRDCVKVLLETGEPYYTVDSLDVLKDAFEVYEA